MINKYSNDPLEHDPWWNSTHLYFTCMCVALFRHVLCFRSVCVLCVGLPTALFSQVVFCPALFRLCCAWAFFSQWLCRCVLLPDSSLSAFVFHDPSLYTVLSRLQLRLSPVSVSPSSLQRNLTRTVGLFVSCLFVQQSCILPSIFPPSVFYYL